MRYAVSIEFEAKQELAEATNWYEEKSKGLGDKFIDYFLEAIDYLEKRPFDFPKIEGEYRQVVLNTFPYVIIFKVEANHVFIIAVFHTSRNPTKKYR